MNEVEFEPGAVAGATCPQCGEPLRWPVAAIRRRSNAAGCTSGIEDVLVCLGHLPPRWLFERLPTTTRQIAVAANWREIDARDGVVPRDWRPAVRRRSGRATLRRWWNSVRGVWRRDVAARCPEKPPAKGGAIDQAAS